jgi:GAF domain-containing protein
MTAPATHPREHERLVPLEETGLLDTSPEAEFDGLAALAATVTGCPIAFVSLVDEERQFFKARFGGIVTETPRDVSFCGHAIVEERSVFLVEDARLDPRFLDKPPVTREPRAEADLVRARDLAAQPRC